MEIKAMGEHRNSHISQWFIGCAEKKWEGKDEILIREGGIHHDKNNLGRC